jgi:hypothetical protein
VWTLITQFEERQYSDIVHNLCRKLSGQTLNEDQLQWCEQWSTALHDYQRGAVATAGRQKGKTTALLHWVIAEALVLSSLNVRFITVCKGAAYAEETVRRVLLKFGSPTIPNLLVIPRGDEHLLLALVQGRQYIFIYDNIRNHDADTDDNSKLVFGTRLPLGEWEHVSSNNYKEGRNPWVPNFYSVNSLELGDDPGSRVNAMHYSLHPPPGGLLRSDIRDYF